MLVLEDILARKQSLIILLDQHGRKRSEILAGLGLPPTAAALSNWPATRTSARNCSPKASALNQVLADVRLPM
jgi:flagellar biosynthesis protein FlgN